MPNEEISRLQIICLPCAGGVSTYFQRLRERLSQDAEFVLIDYAGHGKRMCEPLNESLEEMLDDVYSKIHDKIKHTRYLLFGYSMGSLLAYVLTVDPKYNLKPEHVFLSSFQSPDLLKEERFLLSGTNSVDKFINRYGNIDKRFYEDKRFFEVFVGPLKNDFDCLKKFTLNKFDCIPCSVDVLYGDQDLGKEDVDGWRLYTRGEIEFTALPGGHFFLNDNLDTVQNIVQKKIEEFNL